MVKQKTGIRNLELRLSYVGTHFFGWQVQSSVVSVQGTLNQALCRILGEDKVKTTGASRTDTGVHAHDQHVNFYTDSQIPINGLQRALNHLLPTSIRVLSIRQVPDSFSARYHAGAKHYTYFIHNKRRTSPFTAPYVWPLGYAMNSEAMAQAARLFEGTRCFKALQAARDSRPGSQTTIYQTRVERFGDLIRFDVCGHHYLYHMVRNMISALVMVGRGEWELADLAERMEDGKRARMWITAPASGLHLIRVFYGEGPYPFAEQSDKMRDLLMRPGL